MMTRQKLFNGAIVLLFTVTWLLAFALTLVALAWRYTEPAWLLPAMLVAEILLPVALLLFGRKGCGRFLNLLYQLWQKKTTKTIFLIFTVSFFSWILWPQEPATLPPPGKRKIAVIGGGATGVHAAWMLQQAGVDYQLYEAAGYLGGHAYSAPFQLDNGKTVEIDMGFMFGAPGSYEEFKILLELYGFDRLWSELSYYSKTPGSEWMTDPEGPVEPEVLRFHQLAERDHENPAMNLLPFGWWLDRNGFADSFYHGYQVPFLSILFVTHRGIYENSTRFILNMYSGTGRWIDFRRAESAWLVKGGSSGYYRRLTNELAGSVRLFQPVTRVERHNGKVLVTSVNAANQKNVETFDGAILAVPADVARRIVDTSFFESLVLAQARYDQAMVYLHGDTSVLPGPEKRRGYNFLQKPEFKGEFEMSAMMGRVTKLGNISPQPIVTLNPQQKIDKTKIQVRLGWRHHIQDLWHIAIFDQLLPLVQGRGNIYYAGEWEKFIGHGQALRSGIRAACRFTGKVTLPEKKDQCFTVKLIDARGPGEPESSARLCGKTGAYNFINQMVCHQKPLAEILPLHQP